MTRFFTEEILAPATIQIALGGDDAHHARDVLRIRPGDRFVLCDGARRDHVCVVTAVERDRIAAEVESSEDNRTEPRYEAVLYQGLTKGDKMDDIVRKSVELGVTRIVPVVCARSVSRPKGKGKNRADRWRRIAREAARQCGRGIVPVVTDPVPFEKACGEAAEADVAFLPWEGERNEPVRTVLDACLDVADQAEGGRRPLFSFLIGPEGGFDAAEVDQATEAGIRTVTLGRRILRTETAGPAVLALLTGIVDGP